MDFELEDDGEGESDADWMATFADMSILLLTFFVLLLSFANLDVTKFRMALGSVKDALGVQNVHSGDIMGLTTSPIELSDKESTATIQLVDEVQLLERLQEVIEAKKLGDRVEAGLEERGLVLRVKGTVLFDTARASLRSSAIATLDPIAELAEAIPFPISVEGHTDNVPINTTQFPSNWELSTARATAAMRYLVDEGDVDAKRLGIAGYAHMRPLASNNVPAQRARNRRVEFVFVTPETNAPNMTDLIAHMDAVIRKESSRDAQ